MMRGEKVERRLKAGIPSSHKVTVWTTVMSERLERMRWMRKSKWFDNLARVGEAGLDSSTCSFNVAFHGSLQIFFFFWHFSV